MDNEVLNNILPSWAVSILKDWHLKKRTGRIRIDYSDGGVRAIERSDRIEPPKKKK